ncbi:unnamed protein product [Withania somnifera]
MSSSSSNLHDFVILCLFLLSFLSVTNSQDPSEVYDVLLRNEAPSLVTAKCYTDKDEADEYSIKPGWTNEFVIGTAPGKRMNTFTCELKLEKKHGVFKLFDSNDKSVCYKIDEQCIWKIREDGLCMLSAGKCVLFKWDNNSTTPLVTHIEMKQPIIWERSTIIIHHIVA